MLFRYARVDSITGLVLGVMTRSDILAPVPDDFDGNCRMIYRDGKFLPAKNVKLCSQEDLYGPGAVMVAGKAGQIGFVPEPAWTGETPREFTVCLNRADTEDQLEKQGRLYPALWAAGQTTLPLTLYAAGVYEIQVVGPAPWASDKLRFHVAAAEEK